MTGSLLTVGEVADRLRVNPDKVRGWIHSGELAALNVAARATGRSRLRIDSEELERFLRTRAQTPLRRVRRRATPGITEFF